MKIIVGLGNPGNNYSSTKHNFGFWVVDKLVEQSSLQYKSGKGNFIYAMSQDCMFVKPITFVNNTGLAIKEILNYYDNITIEDFLIIYDDIDLDLGEIRFKAQGSDGGHNGIKSIIYHVESDHFDRLKIGIATPMKMRPSEKYVLKPFPKKYMDLVKEVVRNATKGIDYYLEFGMSESMNNFNKRNNNG